MRIDEINAMAEEVYLEHENNDILYGDSLELRLAYKAGIVDGYNKAKENLYTEEQIVQSMLEISEYIVHALERRYLIDSNEKAKNIIKSLKQK